MADREGVPTKKRDFELKKKKKNLPFRNLKKKCDDFNRNNMVIFM
jgi:hypothetical protein